MNCPQTTVRFVALIGACRWAALRLHLEGQQVGRRGPVHVSCRRRREAKNDSDHRRQRGPLNHGVTLLAQQ